MDKIFQTPGYITKITTMSKNTIRLQVDSQENVSGESMKRLFDMIDQLGNFCFLVNEEIQPEDMVNRRKINKNKNWENDPITKKQLNAVIKMGSLLGEGWNDCIPNTKGEAQDLISKMINEISNRISIQGKIEYDPDFDDYGEYEDHIMDIF